MITEYQPEDTTILIVDDKEPNRELIRDRLARESYDLLVAENGDCALKIAKEVVPDLILLDIMMPDIDGYEVCRRLRADPVTRLIPVIMITALVDRGARLQGLGVGADEFLSKPVDLMELDTRVRAIAGLGRFRRLVAERSRFELFAGKSRDACAVVNRAGVVAFMNDQAARLIPGLGVGQSLPEIAVNAGFAPQPLDAWLDGNSIPGNHYLVHPVTDQRPGVWLQVEVDRVDSQQPDELLCRITDVSALMQKQRQSWSFHSMLAHKFRTPLTGMIGSLELLELDAPDESLPMFECLLKSTRRLQSQIESVLKYVEKRHIQIGAPTAADRLVAMLEEIAHETAATVRISGSLPAEVSVLLTEDALLTIFTELLANSLKFHPDRQPVIQIDLAEAPDHSVVVRWTDNGCHIDKALLPQIGQPYFQAEKDFTGEIPGMGLGLAMVSSLLIECRGSFRIANADDSGGVAATVNLPGTSASH